MTVCYYICMLQVGVSFVKVVVDVIRPSIEVLGRLPGTEIFCERAQFPAATAIPGILIVRINSGSICFANANFIVEKTLRWLAAANDIEKNSLERVRVVVLDMSNVTNIDTSGIIALEELHKNFVSQGTQLAMSNPRWKVIEKLKAAEFVNKVGGGWIFLTVADAVEACLHLKMLAFTTR
nr:low affinity sulfate transporter 3-like [Ipomoea batatas]